MTKTLIQLAQEEAVKTNKIITAIKVEGKLKELSDTVVEEGNIEFITTETKIGIETYRRSVIMLMLSAIHNMYPKDNKLKVYVQYSVSKGVYCEIKGDFEVTQEFLDNLKVKMLDYVAKDIPINKMTLKTSEAVKLFEKYGMDEKVKLEIVLIPEKCKSTYTKRAASTQQKQLFFIAPFRNARTAAQPLPPHSCAYRSADTQ